MTSPPTVPIQNSPALDTAYHDRKCDRMAHVHASHLQFANRPTSSLTLGSDCSPFQLQCPETPNRIVESYPKPRTGVIYPNRFDLGKRFPPSSYSATSRHTFTMWALFMSLTKLAFGNKLAQ